IPCVFTMKIHPGVKPAIWGAVAGAVAVTVVGFSSLGWTLGSTAERMATQRARNRGRSGAGSDLRREVPAPGRCTDEIDRVQQDFVMEPPISNREGRLGYHAWKRCTEFGSCERLRRKAWQLDLKTRPPIGLRR